MLALLSRRSDNAIGRGRRLKKVTSCLHAVLEYRDLGLIEVGDIPIRTIDGRDVQRHHVHSRAESRLRPRHRL